MTTANLKHVERRLRTAARHGDAWVGIRHTGDGSDAREVITGDGFALCRVSGGIPLLPPDTADGCYGIGKRTTAPNLWRFWDTCAEARAVVRELPPTDLTFRLDSATAVVLADATRHGGADLTVLQWVPVAAKALPAALRSFDVDLLSDGVVRVWQAGALVALVMPMHLPVDPRRRPPTYSRAEIDERTRIAAEESEAST